jgi:hypothetical protein
MSFAHLVLILFAVVAVAAILDDAWHCMRPRRPGGAS